jgi:hypothetical protein
MFKHSKERQGRAIRAGLVSKGNAVGYGKGRAASNRFMVWLSHINDELLAQFDLPPCVSRHRTPASPLRPIARAPVCLIALKLVGHPE